MNGAASPFDNRELLEGFLAEANGYLEQISVTIEQLAGGGAEAARDLTRLCHALKGASATVGFKHLAAAAGSMETLGGTVQAGRSQWTAQATQASQYCVLAAARYVEQLGKHERKPSLDDLQRSQEMIESLYAGADEVDEVLEILREEARDHLEQVASHLRHLNRSPERRELLQEIRRPIHTLKGSAATVGFAELSNLAHGFEDLLEFEIEGSGKLSDGRLQLLLDISEGLDHLLGQPAASVRSERVSRLLQRIEDTVSGQRADRAPRAESQASAEPTVAQPPAAEPEERAVQPPVPPSLARTEESREESAPADRLLRIPAARLSEVVKVSGELLVHRSNLEGHFGILQQVAEELTAASSRLARISGRLESEYEARALLGAESAASPQRDGEFDSLEMDRYSELHLISRELAEANSDIGAVEASLTDSVSGIEGFGVRLGRLVSEVADQLGSLQLVPLTQLQGRLFHAVRAASKQTEKEVDLVFDAAGIELDKNVLEELSEPLLHVLRNAVDHGIEPLETRISAGKPERGTVRIAARYLGTQLELVVEDDGGGLDLAALREAAIERQLLSREQALQLSDAQLIQLAFLPKVSTAKAVSQLSGRGVGLDVLQSVVERLRGSASIESTPGKGTRLSLRLPMTMAAMRALFVEAAGERLAIPQMAVQQIVRLSVEDLEERGDQQMVSLGGDSLPVLDLAAYLNLPGDSGVQWPRPALVVQAGAEKMAVLVDTLGGSRDIVVKSLGPLLQGLAGFVGATLAGDGSVVLLLDPSTFARSSVASLPAVPELPTMRESQQVNVLVVDDSLSVRRVLRRLVEARGWRAHLARDGVEALELVQGGLDPNVILLDIEMPRMDGYELTSVLRADPNYAAIPIVMLTSRAGQKHRQKAAQLGANGYLVKPYDEETLIGTVRQVAEL